MPVWKRITRKKKTSSVTREGAPQGDADILLHVTCILLIMTFPIVQMVSCRGPLKIRGPRQLPALPAPLLRLWLSLHLDSIFGYHRLDFGLIFGHHRRMQSFSSLKFDRPSIQHLGLYVCAVFLASFLNCLSRHPLSNWRIPYI